MTLIMRCYADEDATADADFALTAAVVVTAYLAATMLLDIPPSALIDDVLTFVGELL